MHRALLVVAKRPAAGQTKTRLCPPLSGDEAARLYECFLRDVLDVMRQVPGVERSIAYLPDDAEPFFRELAPDMRLVLQHGANLGERLDNLLAGALREGARQAVVISSDSPTLPPPYISAAFDRLDDGADVALGPSDDGGYYLIGLTRPQPRLLREVPMSTPAVLRTTLDLAAQEGLQVGLTPRWYDVDTIAELQRLRAELSSHTSGAEVPELAPHTRAFLRGEV